jgi:hypothetical protein
VAGRSMIRCEVECACKMVAFVAPISKLPAPKSLMVVEATLGSDETVASIATLVMPMAAGYCADAIGTSLSVKFVSPRTILSAPPGGEPPLSA